MYSSSQKRSWGPSWAFSWTPLGTLWGGVFGPLGSFGTAFERPRASQIFLRACAKPSRRPSRMLLQRFLDEVARKFAKLWSLGRTFCRHNALKRRFLKELERFWVKLGSSEPLILQYITAFSRFLYFSLPRV